MQKKLQTGFTLLELMIVVIVIAILSSIAIPSYQAYMARGYRADAKAALVENAQFMERNFTESNRYHKTSANVATTLPVTQSPREGTTARYSITITATTTAFLLKASPVAGSMMQTDACGTFTLNHLGQKRIELNSAVITDNRASECWNR